MHLLKIHINEFTGRTAEDYLAGLWQSWTFVSTNPQETGGNFWTSSSRHLNFGLLTAQALVFSLADFSTSRLLDQHCEILPFILLAPPLWVLNLWQQHFPGEQPGLPSEGQEDVSWHVIDIHRVDVDMSNGVDAKETQCLFSLLAYFFWKKMEFLVLRRGVHLFQYHATHRQFTMLKPFHSSRSRTETAKPWPNRQSSACNLSFFQVQPVRFADAEYYYRRALDGFKEKLGPDHHDPCPQKRWEKLQFWGAQTCTKDTLHTIFSLASNLEAHSMVGHRSWLLVQRSKQTLWWI